MAMKQKNLETAAGIAKLLTVSMRQVGYLVAEGMPKSGPRQRTRFDPRECFAWVRERDRKKFEESQSKEKSDQNNAEVRKLAAQASREELKLAKERGQVVAIADVQSAQEQVNSNIRSRLLQLPSKLAQRLQGNEDQTQIKGIVDAEVHVTLTELVQSAGNVELNG